MLIVIPRVTTKKIKNTVKKTRELKWYPSKYLLIQKAVIEKQRNKRHTEYRNSKMADVNPTLSAITLNINVN